MDVLRLRSHIPIAAPARREPADGTESDLRLVLGFEPAWFHRRCGVDFYERWHSDPIYRYESLVTMQAELSRTFAEAGQWKQGDVRDLATISGCYGAYVIPALFGLPLRYGADRWPALEPGRHLSAEEADRLDLDRALAGPFVEGLFSQMDAIEARWGPVHGYLNWQGVLNNAVHLRGQEIFTDLFDRPEAAQRLFETICEAMIRMAGRVQERQRKSGFYINQMCVSNCTMNMISPVAYRRFILPHESRIAGSFERFGVHTCNWNVTPYLDVLRELPPLGYLDMGMESVLSRARAAFPEARRAVMYSPVRLVEATAGEIAADMERIYRELAPCDVVMADIQADAPDARVKELVAICATLASGGRHRA